jgi:hypothetical protein
MLLISFTFMLFISTEINIDINTIIEVLMKRSNDSLIPKFTYTSLSAIEYILISKLLTKQPLEAKPF